VQKPESFDSLLQQRCGSHVRWGCAPAAENLDSLACSCSWFCDILTLLFRRQCQSATPTPAMRFKSLPRTTPLPLLFRSSITARSGRGWGATTPSAACAPFPISSSKSRRRHRRVKRQCSLLLLQTRSVTIKRTRGQNACARAPMQPPRELAAKSKRRCPSALCSSVAEPSKAFICVLLFSCV
jgi:hypothetical protein